MTDPTPPSAEKKPLLKIEWRCGERTGVYYDGFWTWFDEDGNPNLFWWLEGNGSCDCNRAGIFDLEPMDCGEEIKIVRIAEIINPLEKVLYPSRL